MMYYDRKNIIQEEKLEIYVNTFIDYSTRKIAFQVLVQNYGTRPLAITKASLEFGEENNKLTITALTVCEIVQGSLIDQKSASMIIDPNKSVERIFVFDKQVGSINILHRMREKASNFELVLSSYQGHLYRTSLTAQEFISNPYQGKHPKML